MQFIVDEKVKELGVKIIGLTIKNIDNTTFSEGFEKWRKDEISNLIEQYKNYDIKNDKVIEGFYKLHERVNVPRRKNLPASENLIKLLIKKNNMISINKAVDIYNIISMKSKLCLGAHDIDKLTGNVTLKLTNGSENFIPLGSDLPKPVKEGDYSFIDDDNDIICWLDIRQVDKTKVTEESKNILYLIIGNDENSYEELYQVAQQIIEITTKYCGGEATILNK